ncbi:MAG: GUN4 domain-containing protein [Microcystis panniformis WG22]|nr:GUN4 domain-containing protein [Microcystis panniformis WG22]
MLNSLEPFRKAELTKKLNRLENFASDKLDKFLRERALNLADGNPRLLEYLNNEVLGKKDAEAKLTELEQSPELWKDQIIWEELYQLIDEPLQQVLSHCLVYEIPVPMVALESLGKSLTNYRQQLQRARELGLLEISPELEEENQLYHVSRILPHIISSIQLPAAPEVYSLYRKAHNKLHELWGNESNKNEEKWREIFRLLFADKENDTRFRQGFSQMLAILLPVKYIYEADRALESELRKLKDELPTENFCRQLENYLSQEKWREADEETAWLFYVVMVQQGYKSWNELCSNFPCETLNKIDQLWVKYSQGHFGLSIQKLILEGVGGQPDKEYYTWEQFGKQVEWYINYDWRSYNTLSFSIKESVEGNLPALYTIKNQLSGWMDWDLGWGCVEGVLGDWSLFVTLLSRIET